MSKTKLEDILSIKHPIIMAPMFLVSNTAMVIEGMKKGIAGCIPALNYRTIEELKAAIQELKAAKVPGGSFGFNLIVNQSNPKYRSQLEILCQEGVDFIITSLGSPRETIEQAHQCGIKVFCDVTNLEFAKKVADYKADALIAVNNKAGGHRGEIDPQTLIQTLDQALDLPVISAGGVGNYDELNQMLNYGAVGVSVGSPFIASIESNVSIAYKQGCVDYGAKDIVVTKRISGTPCTVINTPYIQQVGTEQSALEAFLNRFKSLKKWVKMIRFYIGMRDTTKAATEVTYKTVWVAGPSIEHTHAIEPIAAIIDRLTNSK